VVGHENDDEYSNYGARGISVCDSWNTSFTAFYNDMIGSYEEGNR